MSSSGLLLFGACVGLVQLLLVSPGAAVGEAEDEGLQRSSVYYGLVHTAAAAVREGSVCLDQMADTQRGITNRHIWAMKCKYTVCIK